MDKCCLQVLCQSTRDLQLRTNRIMQITMTVKWMLIIPLGCCLALLLQSEHLWSDTRTSSLVEWRQWGHKWTSLFNSWAGEGSDKLGKKIMEAKVIKQLLLHLLLWLLPSYWVCSWSLQPALPPPWRHEHKHPALIKYTVALIMWQLLL